MAENKIDKVEDVQRVEDISAISLSQRDLKFVSFKDSVRKVAEEFDKGKEASKMILNQINSKTLRNLDFKENK